MRRTIKEVESNGLGIHPAPTKPRMPTPVSVYQVSQLAMELARKPDGTLDVGIIEPCYDKALKILLRVQKEINNETES